MNPACRGILPFAMFTRFTPALPQFYTDVPTMEQGFKELCKNFHKMVCYVDNMANVQNLTSEEVEQLKADFAKFQESGFEQYYEAQLQQWIQDNAGFLFTAMAKLVMFGLTDDGHFCAYIPDSWSDIWFDTIVSVDDPLYGHLVIMWDGNGDFSNPHGPSDMPTNYEQLSFKPSINGVTLIGDRSFAELGLVPMTEQEIVDA